MILIADSGGTKTHWKTIGEAKSSEFFTAGINPFYSSAEAIMLLFENELKQQLSSVPQKIFFYGAGISQEDKKGMIANALKKVFSSAIVEVEHDLLAAARATCGNEAGISCILGTGSNSCLFDGNQITDNIPSLGFFLGDEGSGAHLGRKLLQAYFYRELPDELRKKMESRFDMSREHILNKVYFESMPNKYVASFSEIITENKEHPFCSLLLATTFHEFIERHVLKYADYQKLPVHFTGSVAFHNREIIEAVLENMNLKKGVFLKTPMEGLIQYHSK